jgi:hypothetical protein
MRRDLKPVPLLKASKEPAALWHIEARCKLCDAQHFGVHPMALCETLRAIP